MRTFRLNIFMQIEKSTLPYFVYIGPENNQQELLFGALKQSPFPILKYDSVAQWRGEILSIKYLCVFIDLKTIMSTQGEDRAWFNQIEESLQIFRLHMIPNGEVKIFSLNTSYVGVVEIQKAMQELFSHFRGKGIRKFQRVNKYMRVVLESLTTKKTYNCYTLDISEGGAFISGFGPQPSFFSGEKVKIDFIDVNSKPYLIADIKFLISWKDTPKRAPGIGIQASKDYAQVMYDLMHGKYNFN